MVRIMHVDRRALRMHSHCRSYRDRRDGGHEPHQQTDTWIDQTQIYHRLKRHPRSQSSVRRRRHNERRYSQSMVIHHRTRRRLLLRAGPEHTRTMTSFDSECKHDMERASQVRLVLFLSVYSDFPTFKLVLNFDSTDRDGNCSATSSVTRFLISLLSFCFLVLLHVLVVFVATTLTR